MPPRILVLVFPFLLLFSFSLLLFLFLPPTLLSPVHLLSSSPTRLHIKRTLTSWVCQVSLPPSSWAVPSIRRCTRRLSSFAPRKMTRCVTAYFVIFQTHTTHQVSLTYETVCSVSPYNASIVNRFARRIPRDRRRISKSALACAPTPMRRKVLSRLNHQIASALQMATPARPVAQLSQHLVQRALLFPRQMER